jgi:hypothetical protein
MINLNPPRHIPTLPFSNTERAGKGTPDGKVTGHPDVTVSAINGIEFGLSQFSGGTTVPGLMPGTFTFTGLHLTVSYSLGVTWRVLARGRDQRR